MRWLVLVSLGLSGCLMPGVALVDSFGNGGSGVSGGSGANGLGGKSMGTGAVSSGGSLGEAGDEAGVEGGSAGMDVGGKADTGGNTSAAGNTSTAGSGGTTAGDGGSGGSGGTPLTPNPHAWARWPMPNPVGSPGPNFASYDTAQPGVVVDNVTGLTWQAVASGTLMTYVEAEPYCGDLEVGGFSDWRVPTRIELVSLVDYTVAQPGPTIDEAAFPDQPAEEFWSASLTWGNLDYAYGVAFQSGSTVTSPKTEANRVRCVRP